MSPPRWCEPKLSFPNVSFASKTDETYAEDFKSMLKGVVNDYEKAYDERISEIDTRMKAIGEELKAENITETQITKLDTEAKTLFSEKVGIEAEKRILNEFKKNEGIE